ncbi:MAG: T9SS type A sorting domain-containing protein [Ignavibacterium sp.]
MKNVILILIALLILNEHSSAQLLNNSFENWDNGEAVNWLSNDISGDLVSQSSDAVEGNSSVKLQVGDFAGVGLPVFITSADLDGNGHPVNQKYQTLKGSHKLSANGNDQLWISVVMAVNDSTTLGGGMIYLNEDKSEWTEFTVPILYDENSPVPQMAFVTIFLLDTSTGSANIGSFALIDNLRLENTTSVDEEIKSASSFKLDQNYPNPFNPSTKISWNTFSAARNTLKVYNILGNEVAKLVDEYKPAGTYSVNFDAKGLPSGIYFYTLQVGNQVQTKKMILIQ